jgi:hypothetical protein
MKFGLKLDILFDKELLLACKMSPSCLRLYNVIISYKYYLKGLLNDVAIFSKFNYFYLPKSITSTGRRFTIPYFLNLQNFKLTKAFCIMHKVSEIGRNNYDKVRRAIMRVIKTESLQQEVKELTYEGYELKTRELIKNYFKDFLRDKEEYSNYPKDKPYREQIDWLALNCKKPREIFYAKLLITSIYKEPSLSLIYELDATSSGLQIIGMMLKEEDICLLSNVIGNRYVDIYGRYIFELSVQMRSIEEYLTKYCNHIGVDFKAKKPVGNIIDMTSFKEVFILFLNTGAHMLIAMLTRVFRCLNELDKATSQYLSEDLPSEIRDWIIDSSQSKVKDNDYKRVFNYIGGISSKLRNKKKTKALENLIYIHAMASYFISLRENPWLEKTKSLTKRQLAKLPIMALPYSMGSSGRINAWNTYFRDEANLNGFDIDLSNLASIQDLIRVLDRYFSYFKRDI